jgi:predicted MPP superfamily phosphohydrolase
MDFGEIGKVFVRDYFVSNGQGMTDGNIYLCSNGEIVVIVLILRG